MVKLSSINTPLQKDAQFDILGLICAIIVGVVSFFLTPPLGVIEWSVKGVEFAGIVFAGYAVGLMINKFIENDLIDKEKANLERLARSSKMNLEEYLSCIIKEVSSSIMKWAKMSKVDFDYLEYSSYRHTIDFHNYPIDYIDIQIVDYQLKFVVRLHDTAYIRKLVNYVRNSAIEVVLMTDKYHLGSNKSVKLNDDALDRVKMTLIDSILNPTHSLAISFFS